MVPNTFDATIQNRVKFVEYCSGVLSGKSLVWVKNLFSTINRTILSSHDDDFNIKAYQFYKNVNKFITDFVDDVTPASILQTLFICGFEMGLLTSEDEVLSYEEFYEGDSTFNWENVDVYTVLQFDFYTENLIIRRAFYNDYGKDNDTIVAGGLRTLSMLDYFGVS